MTVSIIDKCLNILHNGQLIDYDLAYELATQTKPDDLFQAADSIRSNIHGNYFDLCSIINAKSGKCSEDCRFCAQSSHYNVEIETYDVVDTGETQRLAKENDDHGVKRFSLVTAGRSLSVDKLKQYGKIYEQLQQETQLSFCASFGMLTPEKANLLKSFGVKRYHCNLEACRRYFPQVCTTHTWEEKVETITIAKDAGLEVCSGGIIGMGEQLEHRLKLAFELRELGIMSIPINVLSAIKNTPFEDLEPLSLNEILICIAMFRFINPLAVVRLAGGRSSLGDEQYRCFTVGANGAIVGNYLTTSGNELAKDLKNIADNGFIFENEDDE